MKYNIVKKLYFSYGHRLMDYDGKCAHAHGHNGVLEIELSTEKLDGRGMVYDFGDVKKRLGDFIEQEIDHRMLLREDDPMIAALEGIGEEVFIMKENPTAENIAKLIFVEARTKGLPVVAIRLWETPHAFAEYRDDASQGQGHEVGG
ncbi:6-carboxytetrahydropterin synthase [Acidobacteria bacterium AH-259-D05]|nr:6-carboxytetrahydropterin synthase [Acidobacteria bacterium AH-259-D05]